MSLSGAPARPGSDDPQAYLPEDRRRAARRGHDLPDRVHGAAVFADISGFTALAEALVEELGEQRGPEELTAAVDLVLGEVVDALHAWGGAVLYFSGDAVTCWLDDGLRAAACALAMQQAVHRVGAVTTPGGRQVRLALKVAVAVGPARRFTVGDPAVQRIDVLAGALLDELAEAEGVASAGEVVLTSAVVALLGDRAVLGDQRPATAGEQVRTLTGLVGDVALPPEPALPDDVLAGRLPDEVVQPWLLPTVWSRLAAGRGEFLAELRPCVPLFLRFGGLDLDADDAPAALDAFVRAAQRVVDGYGGNVLQLTVGDKGAYLYAVFGSPVAHEDDAARACAAALDLLALDGQTAVGGLQVGVAAGRLRSGTTGHRHRRTFSCLGDATNLAARLMAAAPPGQAWVSAQVAAAAANAVRSTPLPPVQLKGKALPTVIARLERRLEQGATGPRGLPQLVGRQSELAALRAALDGALGAGGAASVTGLTAEAGTGKSRLVAEVVREAAQRGVRVAHGTGPALGASAPYGSWQPVWRSLLGLDAADPPATVEGRLAQVLAPALLPRLPLAGALVGVPLPDNALTAGFDPKLRKTSLESLAAEQLAHLADRPLLLVLEDAHLLDPLSSDLLLALARVLADLPVAVLLAYRPGPEPLLGLGLERTGAVELTLGPLPPEATTALAAERLAALLGHPAAPGLAAAVAARCEGNPLYVRELCSDLAERGVDAGDAAALDGLDLPASLHSLVLSRIDRLAEAPRRTAKVASVVGRSFTDLLVADGYDELGGATAVAEALVALHAVEVAAPDLAPTSAAGSPWAFSHAVVREVAYESLPFAMRRLLHGGVAAALETGRHGDPDRLLDELAHHWWHSDDDGKKRHHLMRAGVAAQDAYANATALQWFGRLAPLLPGPERAAVLVRTGRVLDLVGDWAGAARAHEEALELAQRHGDAAGAAWARTWLAEVARKRGDFEQAAAGYAAAREAFAGLGDDEGAGQVLHLAGTLASQRGDYVTAGSAYRESLVLRERLGDLTAQAALLSNLAIVAEYEGDLHEAVALAERALDLRTRTGDRWGLGVSHNNLGALDLLLGRHQQAVGRFHEAVRLHTEVGDTWMVAFARNNLGNAHRNLGDHAAAGGHYGAALRTFRAFDDEWAVTMVLEDVAESALARGQAEHALELIGGADAVHDRLGSRRPPDVQERLDGALAPLLAARPEVPVAPALVRGRSLGPADLDALVSTVCGP